MRRERVLEMIGVEVQSPFRVSEPGTLTRRWGMILDRPTRLARNAGRIALDNAELRFLRDGDDRGQGLRAVDLRVRDIQAVQAAAEARSLPLDRAGVVICGTRFNLRTEP